MRVTITVDSATPQEIWNLTAAFQRTAGIPLPRQITTKPTVTVGGSAMGWESPAMTPRRAEALLDEWNKLRAEDRKLAQLEERCPCTCDECVEGGCGVGAGWGAK